MKKEKKASKGNPESWDLPSLFESISEGMCLSEIEYNDQGVAVDYHVVYANPNYRKMLDVKCEELSGKKGSEIFEVDRPFYLDLYSRVAETGQPESFDMHVSSIDKYCSISVFSPDKGFWLH